MLSPQTTHRQAADLTLISVSKSEGNGMKNKGEDGSSEDLPKGKGDVSL